MMVTDRPKCSICDTDTATAWSPIDGLMCKALAQTGHCLNEPKYNCQVCNKEVYRIKDLYFIGGPQVCQACRDTAWEDVMT